MSSEQSSLTQEDEFRRLRKAFVTNRDALSATEHERLFELVRKLGIGKVGKIITEVQLEVDQKKIKRHL